jgi:hypothetical protein
LNTAGFVSGYRGLRRSARSILSLWKAAKFLELENIKFQPD